MKRLALLSVLVLFADGAAVVGQVKPEGRKAWEHIRYLASPEFKGRRSGTPEYRRAAEYVAAKMKEYGLRPGGDNGTWFQEVPLKDWRYVDPPVRLEIVSPARRSYRPGRGRDFAPVSGTGSGIVKGSLVFAGYGVVSEKIPWDDYSGIDPQGKVVLVMPEVPAGMESEEKKAWNLDKKITTAAERGAAGLIELDLSSPGQTGATPRGRPASIQKKETCPPGFVVLRADENFLDDVFYPAEKSWRYPVSRMLRENRPRPMELEAAVEMEAHSTWEDRQAPNVIGILPGRDRKLKAETIIIGGHLDHLGVGVDGYVYPGADDNATSAGTILEVARILQANRFRPRRTVIFAAWAGEELGLRGANYYVEHPVRPLEKTALYINIDMVGTGDTDLWVGGMWEYAELYDVLKQALDPATQKRLFSRMNYRGSDHTAFLRKGIPWISLRTGNPLTTDLSDEHPEYHRPGDGPEYIEPELLELAADYHDKILTFAANTSEKLLDPRHRVRGLHRDAVVADLHCDTIGRYIAGEDLTKDNPTGHVDIPKLKRGAVDIEVFACFTPPPQNECEKSEAARKIFDQIEAVHKLVEENPKDLALILEPADLGAVRNTGKTGLIIGIEGGYALENDLNLLRSFYRSGVRLMTLTHWTRTDWADASGDAAAELGGLTEFGEQVIREMNRLGIIIDVSHVHDETFADVLRATKAPVVASHSSCRALADHHRNLSDDMLKALAENEGVVGISFWPVSLSAEISRSQEILWAEIASKYGLSRDRKIRSDEDPEARKKATGEFEARWAEIRKSVAPATVKNVVDHIAHVIEVTGKADHVGLGSDFDGLNATPLGLENIGLLPAVTEELAARGIKDSDIRKILGENFVRIFTAVDKAAKDMKKGASP